MDFITIVVVVLISVVFGLIGGGLSFIIKMKVAQRRTKKQLNSGKGLIENITPNHEKKDVPPKKEVREEPMREVIEEVREEPQKENTEKDYKEVYSEEYFKYE